MARDKHRPRSRWPGRAAALARRLPPEILHSRALAVIRSRPPREPVALACSGGADSVALVLALWAALPERRGRWLILHFNHRLRGRASAGDARFVQALARGLGERFAGGAWTRPRGAPGAPSEAEAREARHAFMARAMAGAGARVLALGHQRDDVAETVLMRLTRGSGTAGLAAPRPVARMRDGTSRVRPLLDLTAKAIRTALTACGVPWREDATNASGAYFRNRVRRAVLPALAAASPQDVLAGLGASRELLEEDDEALEAWLRELLPEAGSPDLAGLRGRPRALVRRAVRDAWMRMGRAEALGRPAMERIAGAIAAGADLDLGVGSGLSLRIRNGRIRLERESVPAPAPRSEASWPETRLESRRPATTPSGDRLRLDRVRLDAALRRRLARRKVDPATTAFLDPGADWPGWMTARAWKPGDRVRLLGSPGSAKVQDLFVNRKVPRELRRRLPVVILPSGEIAWIPGFPPAARFSVQAGSKIVVQLTYTPARTNVGGFNPGKHHHVRSRQA